MSLIAYAEHRGVTRQAVAHAIRMGRLLKSVVMVRVGGQLRPKIADAALADREWAANTDLSRAPISVKDAAAERVLTPVPPEEPPEDHEAEQQDEDDEDEIPALAEASAREKHFRAKLAELKYRQVAGQLVDAKAVEAAMVDAFTACRTHLLGLPAKAKQSLPHLTLADVEALDLIVRDALELLVSPLAPAAAETAA